MSTAVVFNDTRINAHFGCDRVMDVIEKQLAQRGVTIIASSPCGHVWCQDAGLMRKIAAADLLIINGEGTLHHGTGQAADLMKLAGHPVAAGKPLFLINALYQQNPEEWSALLRHFAGIWARDGRSAAELSAATGRKIGFFGDLTLCDGIIDAHAARQGVVVSDSGNKVISLQLAKLSRSLPDAKFVPVVRELKSVRNRKGLAAGMRRVQDRAVKAIWALRFPGLTLLQDQAQFAALLGTAALQVTGRFHGVCFSILTQTPFVAVTSNSWKIEALLEDCGLSRDRIVSPDLLDPALVQRDWRFTDQEQAAIRGFVEKSGQAARAAFDQIAAAA